MVVNTWPVCVCVCKMASKLSQSLSTYTRLWYLIDARGQVTGRLAVMLSLLLQGKTKPTYHPAVDMGDHIVVINTKKVVFTGRKWDQKLYRHHTGYPGGLKEILAKRVHQKDPTKVLYKAVSGMLPKNHFRKTRLNRLHLFPDSKHIYHQNIYKVLDGPCPVYKRMQDYSDEEVSQYPDLVNVPHL